MQTVILAGGLGTRLKSIAGDLPKALVPAAGKPFIERQLELLRKNGLNEVLLCIGYKGEMIETLLGDGSSLRMKIKYSREDESKLMGTAGAIINAYPLLQDHFIVLYGDSYLPTDYRKVINAFHERGCNALMCVYRNENKWDQSNVAIEGNMVIFYSKNTEGRKLEYIDYGLSIYKKSVIEHYLTAELPLDLGQIQRELVARRQMAAFEVRERFYEIGKPSGLAELEEYFEA